MAKYTIFNYIKIKNIQVLNIKNIFEIDEIYFHYC